MRAGSSSNPTSMIEWKRSCRVRKWCYEKAVEDFEGSSSFPSCFMAAHGQSGFFQRQGDDDNAIHANGT